MAEVVERRFVQEFARYYDLYVPDGEGPFPLLLAMHGYGGDKSSMMRLARRINSADYAIAALQGPHEHIVQPDEPDAQLRYGFGWATNFKFAESLALHRDAILKIMDELSERRRVDASRAFFVGFSQAVALNFRFAFVHPERVRGMVGICGGIPGDWDDEGEYRDGDFDVLLVAGSRDEFYPPERSEKNVRALKRRTRSAELRLFDVGHEVPKDAYPVIDAWLRARV
jgi:polyhydroxybutyrate depolymerase